MPDSASVIRPNFIGSETVIYQNTTATPAALNQSSCTAASAARAAALLSEHGASSYAGSSPLPASPPPRYLPSGVLSRSNATHLHNTASDIRHNGLQHLNRLAMVTAPTCLVSGICIGAANAKFPWTHILPYCLFGVAGCSEPAQASPEVLEMLARIRIINASLPTIGAYAGGFLGLAFGLALPSLSDAQQRRMAALLAAAFVCSSAAGIGMFFTAAAANGMGEALAATTGADIETTSRWSRLGGATTGLIGTFALSCVAAAAYLPDPDNTPRHRYAPVIGS